MPSQAYRLWRTVARAQLDEVARAHLADGTRKRFAVEQLNRAYLLLLASHYQGYCRDLHTECVGHVVRSLQPSPPLEPLVYSEFTRNRQLDRGNAQPESLKEDFRRLGLLFWDELSAADPRAAGWRTALGELNKWRNAIAHRDFDPAKLGGTVVLLRNQVKSWRSMCNELAQAMDVLLRQHLFQLSGQSPW